MARVCKIMTSWAWLLLWVVLEVQSANAQVGGGYPPADEAWDGTDYRALIQRVEKNGLQLPTLADAATKPVFDRMVNADNIPLRMGLNRDLSITIRFQKLDSALQPLHKLVALYSKEAEKGKPYATELARLMVYESKVAGTLLELTEPLISTLPKDGRYQARIADLDQLKSGARRTYAGLVQGVTDTRLYSKPDILRMIEGALADLSSYLPVVTSQDRMDLTQKLTQQISKTTDQEMKTALTQLRDAIEHSRIRT